MISELPAGAQALPIEHVTTHPGFETGISYDMSLVRLGGGGFNVQWRCGFRFWAVESGTVGMLVSRRSF
jgi:hypothetical protein